MVLDKVPAERHNNYFTKIFVDILMMIELIKFFFPQELVDLIDFSTIEVRPNEFTNDDLKKKYSDIVIRLKICGEDAYINVMFEHKSTNDKIGIDQLREYNNARWEEDKSKGTTVRTLIINVLFYHGTRPWEHGTNFNCLYNVKNPVLQKYAMSMPIILIDLNNLEFEKIHGSIDFATALLLLSNIHKSAEKINKALSDLWSKYSKKEIEGLRFEKSHVRYILNTRNGETADMVIDTIENKSTKQLFSCLLLLTMQGLLPTPEQPTRLVSSSPRD